MNTVKTLIFEPSSRPRVALVDDTLENWQAIVGGYIEALRLPGGLHLMCNEEGIRLKLPPNAIIYGHAIVGTFFLIRHDAEGNFTSLTDADIEAWDFKEHRDVADASFEVEKN